MRTVTTGHARTPRGRAVPPAVLPAERRTGRRQQLVQACFTSLGVAAVVALSAVVPSSPPSDSAHRLSDSPADVSDRLWSASWSQRFPGCVAMVLWPQGERPVALVTRSPDGTVHRLAVGSAGRVPSGDRVVGACR